MWMAPTSLEKKKHLVYERMMHSSMMSLLASVGSSESPTSSVSSQRMFYRRLGENDDDDFERDQWIMVNMKNALGNSISGKSPSFF